MARRRSIRAGYKRTLAACRAAKCKAQGKRATCKLDEEALEACERAARGSRTRGLEGAAERAGVTVREVETGGKHSFEFRASFGGSSVGSIKAHRKKLGGRVVYVVRNVDVREPHRRRGIATALYEAAAQEACRRRAALASDERNLGAFSHDFWAKQEAKGRARIVRNRTRPRDLAYILDCAHATDLSGVRLRGLEGALASGSYAGALGKVVGPEPEPEPEPAVELGRARVTKVCPALRFDQVGDKEGIEITVFTPQREYVGRIDAEIRDGDLRVMFSEVEPEYQRCGVGTRLYEHVMRAAQRKRLRLVSDSQRSEAAETFWQKQVKKGRAECIDEQPGHQYVQNEGVRPNVWGCRRFALKKRVRSLRGRRA